MWILLTIYVIEFHENSFRRPRIVTRGHTQWQKLTEAKFLCLTRAWQMVTSRICSWIRMSRRTRPSSSNASSGLMLLLGWQQVGLVWGLGYLRISCPGGWRRKAGNHSGRKTSGCCMCEPWSGVWSANPVGHTHTCSELKCNDSSHNTPTPAYNETLKKQNMFPFSVPGTSQINGGNNTLHLINLDAFSFWGRYSLIRGKRISHLSRP